MQAHSNAHGAARGVNHSADGHEWMVLLSPDTRRMMSTHEVQAEVSAGTLARETLVWRAGMSEWMAIGSIGELDVPVARQHRPAPGWDAPAAPSPRPAAQTQPRAHLQHQQYQHEHYHQHASAPNPQLMQEVVTTGAVAMIGVAVTLYMLSLGGAFAAGGVHSAAHAAPASSATAQKAH
jgi:hypothetical protein